MKCEECQPLIEEYLDNELDDRNSGLVRTHVNSCRSCAEAFEKLRREQQVYGRYRRDIEVSPALWTAVIARIEQEERPGPSLGSRISGWFASILHTPLMSPALAAALVLIAVALTVLVMKYTGKPAPNSGLVASVPEAGPSPTPTSSPNITAENPTSGEKKTGPSPRLAPPRERRKQVEDINSARLAANTARAGSQQTASNMTTEQAVRAAEQSYLAAIALLSRDIKRNESQLDPAVEARFKEALASIDRTIMETRRAVREHPGDAIAAQYLLAAYQEKVEVLKEIASNQ
jgi:hypothetical protein